MKQENTRRAKKTRPEIRAELEKILSEIIGECYVCKDDFVINDQINGVAFKLFLINRADLIIEQQNFLNKLL